MGHRPGTPGPAQPTLRGSHSGCGGEGVRAGLDPEELVLRQLLTGLTDAQTT